MRPSAGRRGGGDAVDAGLQVAHGAGGLRQHAHARALAARALGEVVLDVGKLGVQALGGGEERLRGLDGSELVEDDAGVVEQDRLARVGLKHVDGGRRGGQQDRGARALAQGELEERAARLVAAVGIGDLAGLGAEGAEPGPVGGGEACGGGGDQAGGGDGLVRGRAGGFGSIDETEGHVSVHRPAPKIPEDGPAYTEVGMDTRTSVQPFKRLRQVADTTPRPVPHPRRRTSMTLATAPRRAARRMSSEDSLALWREYRRTNDRALRDRLVLTFAPLVKYIVYKKLREMPARCEAEDFIACGLEALIHSIERYDPDKGATLEQYAWTRIHGAVLDELRRQDWAPRSVRRWERDIEKVVESFTVLHGRRPTTAELADALGVQVDELRRRRDEIARSDVTSLNTPVLADDQTTIERVDTIAGDDPREDPLHAAAQSEAKDLFRAAFARLPRREREVAVLLYVKHMTLSEIGEILGVSESRVCQIHTAMKKTLRQALQADEQLFAMVA